MKISMSLTERLSYIEDRAKALLPNHIETEAEKAFEKALAHSVKPGCYCGYVTKADYDACISFYDEYWSLQEQIEDDNNVDGNTQSLLIKQQNDVQDELEKIYQKYLS